MNRASTFLLSAVLAFFALKTAVLHAAITPGAELIFTMTADPAAARPRNHLSRPFSLSTASPHSTE